MLLRKPQQTQFPSNHHSSPPLPPLCHPPTLFLVSPSLNFPFLTNTFLHSCRPLLIKGFAYNIYSLYLRRGSSVQVWLSFTAAPPDVAVIQILAQPSLPCLSLPQATVFFLFYPRHGLFIDNESLSKEIFGLMKRSIFQSALFVSIVGCQEKVELSWVVWSGRKESYHLLFEWHSLLCIYLIVISLP